MQKQMISEEQREKIKRESKQIIDNFAKSLENVKLRGKHEKKEIGGFREEGQGKKGNEDFRRIMFANAHNKDENNIIAETKKW